MSIEDKCVKLAEEIVGGLPIRSKRIRNELKESLAYALEREVESVCEMADVRIEDFEEGAKAGVVTPEYRASWWRRFAW